MTKYKFVTDAREGLAIVINHTPGSFNYINGAGELISKTWFAQAGKFYNGFAIVYDSQQKCNFINPKGELLSPVWFQHCSNFDDNGLALVSYMQEDLMNVYNLINKEGKLMFPEHLVYISEFRNGMAAVCLGFNKWNAINTFGQCILKKNYASVTIFQNGMVCVEENHKYNIIKPFENDGKEISSEWFNMCQEYHEVAVVGKIDKPLTEMKYNFLNDKGQLLSPNLWFDDTVATRYMGFDEVGHFTVYMKRTKNQGLKRYANILTLDGKLLFDNWMEEYTCG